VLTENQLRFTAKMFGRYLKNNIENLEREYLRTNLSIPFALFCFEKFADLHKPLSSDSTNILS
jgi:hypothetical protein